MCLEVLLPAFVIQMMVSVYMLVLTSWIQTGKAVTKDLLGVLENKTVGRQDIAKEIRDLQGSDHSDVGL